MPQAAKARPHFNFSHPNSANKKRPHENGNQIEKETVAISFDMLNEFIKEWKSVYEKSASPNPEVSEKADYDYYVYNFPESSDVDQTYKDMLIEYDRKLDA